MKGKKKMNWVLVTQEERKKVMHQKIYSLQKNGLKRKVLVDIDPRKEDRAIRA